MATFTAGPAQTGVQPKGLRVGLVSQRADLSLDGVSTSVGHTFRMLKIPAHAKVVYMQFQVNIAGEYTMHAGDSVNDQRFRSHSTYSAGVGDVTPGVRAIGYSYSADDALIIKISLASVLTLGGGVHAQVIFSMDN
jgi:hypothetical protein